MRRLLPLAALFALVLYFSFAARGSNGEMLFLTKDNLFNIAKQQSVILLIAFGMTLIIISGGVDLSVGSVAAFCGVIAAWMIWRNLLLAGFLGITLLPWSGRALDLTDILTLAGGLLVGVILYAAVDRLLGDVARKGLLLRSTS